MRGKKEKERRGNSLSTGCAEHIEQLDFFFCLKEMQKYNQPKTAGTKKDQRETESMNIQIATSGSVRMGDIFSYDNNTYVYIGVKADDKRVADQILAVRTECLEKGIKDKYELFFIHDRKLPFTFEVPLERMPGHCVGYQLDIDTGEIIIDYIQPDRQIRCKTKRVRKKQMQAIKGMQGN